MIISAKQNSDGLSAIIRDFKKYTARKLIQWVTSNNGESRREWMELVLKYNAKKFKSNQTYKLWQSGNHPKVLLHPKFIARKINYIHNNQVASEIVGKQKDYKYSSARNYVGRTDYCIPVEIIDFGVQEGYIFG